MKIVRTAAFARAGLVGNPSDGYYGKTISASIRNYAARVVLYEWPEIEIVLSRQDRCQFERLDDLVEDVRVNGLYGGLRLIKASVKTFADYCRSQGLLLPNRNFALRYETDIPRQVGLAGSSAIITAVFRALTRFYEVSIPRPVLPTLILDVERKEIGIAAGLQDRVCQVYEGVVYMDFERTHLERCGYGHYEPIDPTLLPPLYLAFRRDLAEISGIVHSDLRARWNRGEPEVVEGMKTCAALAERGRGCLLAGDIGGFAEAMDRNFDVRASICTLDPRNVNMVHLARSLGLPANYAGSGGSIVGVCEDDRQFARLSEAFVDLNCSVVRPRVGGDDG
jgi:glucuronokinase